jgi:hypothetical protein
MTIRRVLVLCALAAVVGSAPIVSAQAPTADKKEQEKRNKNQQEDVTTLVQLVDMASATPAPAAGDQKQGDVGITWNSNHFIKGQDGSTYVPFTLTVDRAALSSPNAAVYIRAIAKGAAPAAAAAPAPADKGNDKDKDKGKAAAPRVIYPWDNAYFVNVKADGVMQRAMQLPGGEYDVFIAIKDQSTGDKKQMPKTGLLRKTLVVPNFKGTDLATSSIMIGTVEPLAQALSPQQQQENPYTFGTMKIVPMDVPKLAKSGELSLIFWIYNAALDPLTKKPNVTVEYSFNQKMGETEKYFNKTAPQDLNAMTLPPEFDLAAGHQLPGSLAVPLASFPAGDYRLEIKITDKAAGKTLTQNVNFTVNPA